MIEQTTNKTPKTLEHNLADALDCFWNASLTSVSALGTPDAYAAVGAMAQGFAAVAAHLRESQSVPQEAALTDVIKHIRAAMRNGGLPEGHAIIEHAELHDGSGLVAQTVVIAATGQEYVRTVHTDEAYGV